MREGGMGQLCSILVNSAFTTATAVHLPQQILKTNLVSRGSLQQLVWKTQTLPSKNQDPSQQYRGRGFIVYAPSTPLPPSGSDNHGASSWYVSLSIHYSFQKPDNKARIFKIFFVYLITQTRGKG